MSDDHEPLVIDIGTGHLKAGFASDDAPKHLIPMVIGEPKAAGVLVGLEQKDFYIGKEALDKKQFLNLRYPVERGKIKNDKDAIEDIKNIIIHLMTNDMLISGDEYNCMITEPPNNPKEIREAIVDLMYVHSLFIFFVTAFANPAN